VRADAGFKLGGVDYSHFVGLAGDVQYRRIYADGYFHRDEPDELLRPLCVADGLCYGVVLL